MLESIEEKVDDLGIEEVFVYGHSMGGYLSLRLAAKGEGWWKDKLQCVLLESPMTSYPIGIENQLNTFSRLLLPLIRLALRREYLISCLVCAASIECRKQKRPEKTSRSRA